MWLADGSPDYMQDPRLPSAIRLKEEKKRLQRVLLEQPYVGATSTVAAAAGFTPGGVPSSPATLSSTTTPASSAPVSRRNSIRKPSAGPQPAAPADDVAVSPQRTSGQGNVAPQSDGGAAAAPSPSRSVTPNRVGRSDALACVTPNSSVKRVKRSPSPSPVPAARPHAAVLTSALLQLHRSPAGASPNRSVSAQRRRRQVRHRLVYCPLRCCEGSLGTERNVRVRWGCFRGFNTRRRHLLSL